jgi:hypothetical protein
MEEKRYRAVRYEREPEDLTGRWACDGEDGRFRAGKPSAMAHRESS